jgi:hypothetical protein
MFNRVVYRFMVSMMDETETSSHMLFKKFTELYREVYFAGIPIKIHFNFSQMNKRTIYIHGTCKYPYEVCMDNEDYNIENAIFTGIDIMDMINDHEKIVTVLDLVLVNDINCSELIDAYMAINE